MKFLREPLVHFLCIGVAIYLLYGAFAEPALEFLLPDVRGRVGVVSHAAKDLEEVPIALVFPVVIFVVGF